MGDAMEGQHDLRPLSLEESSDSAITVLERGEKASTEVTATYVGCGSPPGHCARG